MKLFITYNQETIGKLIFTNDKFELNYYDNWIKNGISITPYL